MKKRLFSLCLIGCFILTCVGMAFAAPQSAPYCLSENSVNELNDIYKKSLESENGTLTQDWYDETLNFYQQALKNPGVEIKPTERWLNAVDKQYNDDIKKVEKQIDSTPAEFSENITKNTASVSAVYAVTPTTVNAGTTYTFSTANCGAHGEYEAYDEDDGNFKHGWGTTSGGYADALAQYTNEVHESATTWAWVGKAIKVSGSDTARISFDGKWEYYLMGWTLPVLAKGTVKAAVYDVTTGATVATTTIANQSIAGPIPVDDSSDFTNYIDVNLVSGHTYYLRMQCWAYVSAGAFGDADLISGSDIPARGGDGVDYHSIKITWP